MASAIRLASTSRWRTLGDEGMLDGVARLNLPRRTEIPPGWVVNEDWDYCWLPAPEAAVPTQPNQDRGTAGG